MGTTSLGRALTWTHWENPVDKKQGQHIAAGNGHPPMGLNYGSPYIVVVR